MNPRIDTVKMNLWGGAFTENIEFQPGLNLLSGENGTGKTMVLKAIRQSAGVTYSGISMNVPPRILSMSPKRNSERRAAEDVLRIVRQNEQLLSNQQQQQLNNSINDHAVETYLGVSEIFFTTYEERCKSAGGHQQEIMTTVTNEFNTTLREVFPNYELRAEWTAGTGPTLSLYKNGSTNIPLMALSCGEQEVLSMVFNLHSAQKITDVFLIDEPEVHLNWHLEERLFRFFREFCSQHGKQIIIATHSRTIFTSSLIDRVQFLSWLDGRVVVSNKISDSSRRRLAGEAIDIIRLGNFSRPTFFVEDTAHEATLNAILAINGITANVVRCGTKSQVRAMFRISQKEGGWENGYFLEDGDGEGRPDGHEDERFIHLDRYCMENYLIDYDTMSAITGKDLPTLQALMLDVIREKKGILFRKVKSLDFVVNQLTATDMTVDNLSQVDVSLLLPAILKKLDRSTNDYIDEYVDIAFKSERANDILPTSLLAAIDEVRRNATPSQSPDLPDIPG